MSFIEKGFSMFAIDEERQKFVDRLCDKYKDIQAIKTEIINKSNEFCDQVEDLYIKNNGDMGEFKATKKLFVKFACVYFSFQCVSFAFEDSLMKINSLTEFKKKAFEIQNIYESSIKELEEKLIDSANKSHIEALKNKRNKSLEIKMSELRIECPSYYGKQRTGSAMELLEKVDIKISDLEMDENKDFILTGRKIRNLKGGLGLNGNKAPRVSNDDKIKLKLPITSIN